MFHRLSVHRVQVGIVVLALSGGLLFPRASRAETPSSQRVAAEADRLLERALRKAGQQPAPLADDADFLRRVTLDLAGRIPTPREIMLFGLDPSPEKRSRVIDRLLQSDGYARNWAGYWRDVVMMRATDQRARFGQQAFENWLADQFRQNRPWDEIVTDLLTATGDVREKGETVFIFAHNGDAKELAAETSRIFLGIQIQCANCHDHPTDIWKRQQFHELAAFFPRVAVRPVRDPQRNRIRSWEVVSADYGRRGLFDLGGLLLRFDRNKDNKISRSEVKGTPLEERFDRLRRFADRNRDGALSRSELERIGQAMRRRQRPVEYYMPDLNDPSSRGKRMEPVFFVGTQKVESGLKDADRRRELARLVTSPENKWFARAFVNRIWAELLGEGFYSPVDDLGPQRTARYPEVLDLLADGFTRSGYDVRWLFRTITNTRAYQRQIRHQRASEAAPPFAAAKPARLRSDQLYNSLTQVLGVSRIRSVSLGRRPGYRRGGGERFAFASLFGFDPSTPQDDLLGTVPQSLFFMNSTDLNNLIRGTGNTRLARILRDNPQNDDALSEVYLLVLGREPSQKERDICNRYLARVKNRTEAFEDILWSLLNSSEFQTKR